MARTIEIVNNEKEIMEIAEATRKSLDANNGIKIPSTAAVATIMAEGIRQAIIWMAQNKTTEDDLSLDMFGLMEMGVSYRAGNEESEKEGNFTPWITPGQGMKTMIKSDALTEAENEE